MQSWSFAARRLGGPQAGAWEPERANQIKLSSYLLLAPSPFKGEVRRGMGVFLAPELPHPHPNPPLEGEGVFQRKIDANQVT
ncbi:MAG: hypothetical protein A2075_00450 [Geobacteraceae bacterium GWC2_58_44]|nr:MAG: hypothetical protein A2075_00450 [Geobacteraceae bacterium GWC2_58_44]